MAELETAVGSKSPIKRIHHQNLPLKEKQVSKEETNISIKNNSKIETGVNNKENVSTSDNEKDFSRKTFSISESTNEKINDLDRSGIFIYVFSS